MCDVHMRAHLVDKSQMICLPINLRCNNVANCPDVSVSRQVPSSLSTTMICRTRTTVRKVPAALRIAFCATIKNVSIQNTGWSLDTYLCRIRYVDSCDGVDDCGDETDERNCIRLPAHESKQMPCEVDTGPLSGTMRDTAIIGLTVLLVVMTLINVTLAIYACQQRRPNRFVQLTLWVNDYSLSAYYYRLV